jgi:3-dehydroquinate synthetase
MFEVKNRKSKVDLTRQFFAISLCDMFDYNSKIEFEPGRIVEFVCPLETPFPIYFGSDIEDRFGETLARMIQKDPPDRLFLVTDRIIFNLHGERFAGRLHGRFEDVKVCLLPRGERGKTFEALQTLCDHLVEKGVSKRSLLVAFGGGSVGNITGLAAGLIFRGIRFIEIPTTLSHQTDGVLSNKQAVNGKYGKNHFGLYRAPVHAWVDTRYTETETARHKNSGIVEGVKNGLIDQIEFIPHLESNIKPHGDYSRPEIHDLVYRLIVSKMEIIKKDPTEKRYGMILEYGHTFAHAVEWLSDGLLTHGEAVSIGMKIAAELSARLGYIDKQAVGLHYRLMDDLLAMTPDLPENIGPGDLIRTMYTDNKKIGGDVRYVLLEKIGQCQKGDGDYLIRVDKKIVEDVLGRFMEHYG